MHHANSTQRVRHYLLSEESRKELVLVRDQMFLMAEIAKIVDPERGDRTVLIIRRSLIATFFQEIGFQIDEVLDTVRPSAESRDHSRAH